MCVAREQVTWITKMNQHFREKNMSFIISARTFPHCANCPFSLYKNPIHCNKRGWYASHVLRNNEWNPLCIGDYMCEEHKRAWILRTELCLYYNYSISVHQTDIGARCESMTWSTGNFDKKHKAFDFIHHFCLLLNNDYVENLSEKHTDTILSLTNYIFH